MDAATFRAAYPEFSDLTLYPDAAVNRQIGFSGRLLNADRWADVLDDATMLFVAHNLALGRRNAANPKAPGAVQGALSAKAVDKVSGSYDTGFVALEDAGYWGMTAYGLQLLQLARMFGAGPIQVC